MNVNPGKIKQIYDENRRYRAILEQNAIDLANKTQAELARTLYLSEETVKKIWNMI